MKKDRTDRVLHLLRVGVALLGVLSFWLLSPILTPVLESVLGQATLFSTALTLPEGAVLTLRERFAPDLVLSQNMNSLINLVSQVPESHGEPSLKSLSAKDNKSLIQEDEGSTYDLQSIPPEYRGALVEQTIVGEDGNNAFVRWQNAWIRNYTRLSPHEILEVLKKDTALKLEDSNRPQVLLYHTHTTESYDPSPGEAYDTRNNWRDEDKTNNMAAVGAALAEELTALGVQVIHDTTLHDFPSYNGAYDRSRATIRKYMDQYPSIRVAIDLHRDAVIYEDLSVMKPIVEVEGRKAAQLMIIAPCDDSKGSVGVPRWAENFRFAVGLANCLEKKYPGLTRPIFFCYRNYNLDLTDGSLLMEFGTNGNNLREAVYTARLLAPVLAEYLLMHTS